MKPALALVKQVARAPEQCSWCNYPIVRFSAVYRYLLAGSDLELAFCTDRCGEIEARVSARGPVYIRYQLPDEQGVSDAAQRHRDRKRALQKLSSAA
jgi:hypothetical protein